ncbi:uncharacterized protein LOC130804289 [Amaranthus tricolor]|uniref:uncharacterized protein LOC130804289 n=1 Tax=Amaranthus tricolor TaxID=29722 RepID=UPI002590D315|nr:uncharacterized protein LOC130804289 [Amaranthus tricolor]
MKSSNFMSLSYLQNQNFGGLNGFQSTNSELSTIMGNNFDNGYLGGGIENDYSCMNQFGYGSPHDSSQFSYMSPVSYSSLMPTAMENVSLASPPQLMDYRWSFPCDDSIKTDILLAQPYKPTIKDVRKCVNGARLAQRHSSVLSNTPSIDASKSSNKRKVIEQLVDNARKFKTMDAPLKRSQKLSDKISALQELVSPYGKVTHF